MADKNSLNTVNDTRSNLVEKTCKLYDDINQINALYNSISRNGINDNLFFKLMHLNIRSLVHKSEDLLDYLNNFSFKYNIIGISETWMNDDNIKLINITGYDFVGKNRSGKHGGGIGLYIDNGITYKTRDDINSISSIELFSIEITNDCSNKNAIIVITYRPPTYDANMYLQQIEPVLQIISLENKLVYLIGDMNINLLDADSNASKFQLQRLLTSYNLSTLITTPTRISLNKNSVIDNIFTSEPNAVELCGTQVCDLSDHIPIFIIVNMKSNRIKNHFLKEKLYSFTSERINRLNEYLINMDWSNVLNCENVNVGFQRFIEIFVKNFNECCRISSARKIKKISRDKLWITDDLKIMLNRKTKLYTKYLKNPNIENLIELKSIRQSCIKF
ncbi:hypothetical protein HELRODRAFT_174321 [Helobdella robusta]|uniref:Endonuclease/exonuclease/phosphatase domain-containing protein n=1 Tax=Helobdella robusta TaxID=6412 RepID=T1F800_HELRO|nr:hypothetical protein HELRODRAFT_174321 [Helobdella robusta]ESO02879.1 hypothetical protein HELRODRAFT_174321 [Helobdella robusta]